MSALRTSAYLPSTLSAYLPSTLSVLVALHRKTHRQTVIHTHTCTHTHILGARAQMHTYYAVPSTNTRVYAVHILRRTLVERLRV
jgi:hypothetical protein